MERIGFGKLEELSTALGTNKDREGEKKKRANQSFYIQFCLCRTVRGDKKTRQR